MEDYLVEYYDVETGRVKQHIQLTKCEYEEIVLDIQTIDLFLSYVDYVFMTVENCKEFLNTIRASIQQEIKFADSNRVLLNWLNSFYVWGNYVKRSYGKESIGSLITNYAGYDSLYLAHRFRSILVHQSMLINVFSYDVLNEKSKYVINSKLVMSEKEINKLRVKIKEDLLNNPEVDVENFTGKFLCEFFKINKYISENIQEDLSKHETNIMKYLPPKLPNMYNCRIVSKTGVELICVGRKLELLAIKKQYFINNVFSMSD